VFKVYIENGKESIEGCFTHMRETFMIASGLMKEKMVLVLFCFPMETFSRVSLEMINEKALGFFTSMNLRKYILALGIIIKDKEVDSCY